MRAPAVVVRRLLAVVVGVLRDLVEPGAVVVIRDLHHEHVTLPMPARVAHPRFNALVHRRLAVRVDESVYLRPLERNRDMVFRLEDLKRKFEVHDAGHARHVTRVERVFGGATREVLALLLRRPRLIRNLVALNHANTTRNPADRA